MLGLFMGMFFSCLLIIYLHPCFTTYSLLQDFVLHSHVRVCLRACARVYVIRILFVLGE